MSSNNPPWYKELNRYHWFVLTVAALGWLFDTMDQQLFVLARAPAMAELIAKPSERVFYGGLATSVFLAGWATGGILFGILGDKIGRAKTMLWTIVIYSVCTGFSAFSTGFWDFAFYRFVTGLGVGGEFAVGVALVAEVMPERPRPYALGFLQALSAVGNVTAALIFLGLNQLGVSEETGATGKIGIFPGLELSQWRLMFLIGTLPALLALVIRRRLKEPERWSAQAGGAAVEKQLGSVTELFTTPIWRTRALLGLILASAGVIGLWGVGFFSPELVRTTFVRTYLEHHHDDFWSGDRAFLRAVVSNPSLAAAFKTAVDEKQVQLDQVASATRYDSDAQDVFKELVLIQKDRDAKKETKPVSAALVFERLQGKRDEALRKAAKDGVPPPPPATLAFRRESLMKYLGLLPGSASPEASAAPKDDAWFKGEMARFKKRADRINHYVSFWAGITSILQNIGGFFGVYMFGVLSQRIGRRPTFAISFLIALGSTLLVFTQLSHPTDVFWMIPIMGFCQLSLFGGYAIYFPELFPTRLRSTGTSFCYNVGRFVAAFGPTALGALTTIVYADFPEPFRWAASTMCLCFVAGLLVLPFLPETQGKPLPE